MKASGNETAAPQSTAETRRISLCTNLFWKKHEDAVKNIIDTASEIAQQLFFVRLLGRSKTSLTFESASQYIMAPGTFRSKYKISVAARSRRSLRKTYKNGSSDFLVKQGARWYPGRGQNWLVRRMQRSSLLNYRNRCQNLVGARRKHTRPHPHQAEPDQVPALQSAAYAAE